MEIWFWVWLALAVILSIAEIFTGGFFLLPFGVGAAVAALLEYLNVDIVWQWVAFLGISFVMLVLLRRLSDRITHEPPQRMGADRLIGKEGVVIERLVPHSPRGQVRVEREEWRAETPDDSEIAEGARVNVVAVDGTHLVVESVETPVQD